MVEESKPTMITEKRSTKVDTQRSRKTIKESWSTMVIKQQLIKVGQQRSPKNNRR